MLARLCSFTFLCAGSAMAADVWPDKEWATETPASQGLSTAGLEEAAAYADRHGGGSGCVIRHGYLVKEWGSPTTPGAHATGLAVGPTPGSRQRTAPRAPLRKASASRLHNV